MGGYANNQEMYERIRGGLAARLAERRTMSAEDLAEGPHTFLIVGDYDILNAAMPRPLEPLMLSGDPSEGPVVGRVRPELMGPGRRPRYVQTYLSEGAPDRHIDA